MFGEQCIWDNEEVRVRINKKFNKEKNKVNYE